MSAGAVRGGGAALLAAEADRALVTLEPELIRWRREVHAHPEPGFEEHATAALMVTGFGGLGLAVHTGIAGTGVVVDLDGALPGPRVLVRAELDALPVREATGLSFAADGPLGHLCGHDAHLAALAGVAAVLAARREALRGSVRFCLQPAEELLAGAAPMVEAGVLDRVDMALGAHVLSGVPYGTVSTNPGTVLAGADFFRLVVSGGAGHAGTPGQFADAILAAAHVMTALQPLAARETPIGEDLVVGIGSVHAGTAANAAPEDVILLGNIRWFASAVGEYARRRVVEVAAGVAGALGCSARLEWTGHAPVLANDPALAAIAEGAIAAAGLAAVVHAPPLAASDDFAEFSIRVPSVFLGVGCGTGASAPHHHPRFEIDERAVLLTARVECSVLLALLGNARHPAPPPTGGGDARRVPPSCEATQTPSVA
ncbi:peptidase M20 [Sinomonas cellulolyticus]|uniref:Amidohydrolase n=1 Tax=Sinomonas cellulolyticus TaxID=2801916 RepID=A0ABS1K356_9MICC|nr:MULTISPECIES: amidohydrolase [Sinomonas]MBL0706081.1 amidohydrolase [Sinomonas cellulolyticus]GHG43386.1 peptidase M20 [Sinomonas sp. KCTC 49339]